MLMYLLSDSFTHTSLTPKLLCFCFYFVFILDDFMEFSMSFHKEDFDATMCTALKRDKTGNISFKLLKCSTDLPSLCKQKPGVE